MYYAGIGARSTPPQILSVMTRLASKLEGMGYTLRSGGAAGADTAFERGVS
jgi:predicted Rossmann fold nucleotide-binding protein DprA/Smf involved in DNA uptake